MTERLPGRHAAHSGGCPGLVDYSSHADPWVSSSRWWPYEMIVMNICTYLLVSYFTGKQGVTIWSQFGIDQGRLKGDFLIGLALLLPSLVVGFAGLYGVAYLLWGTQPADPRFQALPLSAVLLAAVAFPRFVIYRLAGFLPLTVLFGYLYTRLRRMLPLLVVHALMDTFNIAIILLTSMAAAQGEPQVRPPRRLPSSDRRNRAPQGPAHSDFRQ